ncbi:hypothetical protein [Merdimmobilis hominis]|uniref:Uncharacterized protein n=1 Tax=uncultured Anaerotruncus sp. TaxID=905011 RepID=A0A6N2S5J5_9FIRM|nr:hypothetical protein [Merdimmobilis hominis]MCD4836376.1 hypothetical protein [Merdimmobilis hominis]
MENRRGMADRYCPSKKRIVPVKMPEKRNCPQPMDCMDSSCKAQGCFEIVPEKNQFEG